MVEDKLMCRLCLHTYHNDQELIDVFSDEGKAQQIAAKILYTVTVLITENDPTPKVICQVCLNRINSYVRYAALTRSSNLKFMNSTHVPTNSSYKEEINKAMKISIQSLYYNSHHLDISGVYESLVHYMKNSENNQTSQSKHESEFDRLVLQNCNNNNSCLSGIGTDIANLDKGFLPLVLPEVPSTLTCNVLNTDVANSDNSATPLVLTEVPPTNGSNITTTNLKTNVINLDKGLTPMVLTEVPHVNGSKIVHNVNKIYSTSQLRSCRSHESTAIINTTNDHDYSSHNITNNSNVNVNGTTFIDNDIICLDDDDDNDDIQVILNNVVHPLNQWLPNGITPRDRIVPKKNVKRISKRSFNMERKLVSCGQINHSTSVSNSLNTSTVEMTVTPDISLPTVSANSINGTCNTYNNISPQMPMRHFTIEQSPSSLITPQTGFHFLFNTDVTVDLTDESQQKIERRSKRTIKKQDYKSTPHSKKICKPTPVPDTLKTIVHQTSSSSLPTLRSSYQLQSSSSSQQPLPLAEPSLSMHPSTSSLTTPSLSTLSLSTPSKSTLSKSTPSKSTPSKSTPSKSTPSTSTPFLSTLSLSTPPLSTLPLPTPPPPLSPPLSSSASLTKTILLKKSTKQVSNTRSKRTSIASAVNSHIQKKFSHRLGKQMEIENWEVSLNPIKLSLLQCPICEKYYSTVKGRELHEIKEHRYLPKFRKSSEDIISTLDNSEGIEQQQFFTYLNLVKQSSTSYNVIDLLANRKHLLTALKKFGNAKGSYHCQFCEYKTNRLFILWAHMSCSHIQFSSDARSNSYCFMCNRTLNKRTQFLKHLDKCTLKNLENVGTSTKHFSCELCNYEGNILSDFEKHLWSHVDETQKT